MSFKMGGENQDCIVVVFLILVVDMLFHFLF